MWARDVRASAVRRPAVVTWVAWSVLALTWPANAQTTGQVRGEVVDDAGNAIAGAAVELRSLDGDDPTVRLETSTDGRFAQDGVAAGLYAVTAEHQTLGSEAYRLLVRPDRTVEVRFVLEPGRRRPAWAIAADDEFAETFAAGVAASRNGARRDAIAFFRRAIELNAACLECHYNVAVAHTELEEWAAAERSFRETLNVDPEYAAAYYGLAQVYVRWGRPDEAAEARNAATRIAMATFEAARERAVAAVARGAALYADGNVVDARRLFEEAIAESAGYPDAHYWLGMTLDQLNDPTAAEAAFRRYLALAPTGEHAGTARARLIDPPNQ